MVMPHKNVIPKTPQSLFFSAAGVFLSIVPLFLIGLITFTEGLQKVIFASLLVSMWIAFFMANNKNLKEAGISPKGVILRNR